jgi:SAM-dependent methyltransferase
VRATIYGLTLVACAAAQHPAPLATSDVVARSHAILAALDHGDVAAVRPQLGASYVHFEGKVVDRDGELDRLAKRAASSPQIASRTWSDERVFVGASTAMFIGKAREQQSGNEVHGGGYIYDGWYTLTWARDDVDWKLIYVGWKPAAAQAASAGWNQIFHNAVGFNHEPNRLLTTAVAGVAPGDALDVATGQGRNALYLAAHGWKVTGIDIADEGLRQAREAATRDKLALDLVNTDVTTYDFGHERWDLVTLIYAPSALKRIPDIQRAIRPGGLFVYEYFAPESPDDDDAAAPGELKKQFAGWDILRDDVVDDVPDWAQDKAMLERFVARKR